MYAVESSFWPMKSHTMCLGTVGECSWTWARTRPGIMPAVVYTVMRKCLDSSPSEFSLLITEVAQKSWSHWPKTASYMKKEPCSHRKESQRLVFLAPSWPEEQWEDWVYRRGLGTLLEICRQWVNLLDDVSPSCISWWNREVQLSLYFWGNKTLQRQSYPKSYWKGDAEPENKILPPKLQNYNIIYIGPSKKMQVTEEWDVSVFSR